MWRRFRDWLERRRHRSRVGVGSDIGLADDRDLVLSLSPSRIPNFKQLSHLPALLNQRERFWIKVFGTTAIISGLVLFGVLFSHKLRVVAAPGGSLAEGLVGTPQFINPVLARDQTVDSELTRLLFPGLLKIGADLRPTPDLAESITPSEDRLTYTLRLRPDLHWSDGESLTAADVVFTIGLIKDAAFASPSYSSFQDVAVEAPDDQTIVFRLTKIQTSFPFYLTIGILPQHSWADIESNPQAMPLAELNVKPISSGPFKFQSVTKDRNGTIRAMTFTRNKFYYGPAPYLNKYTIKFYIDRESAIEAMKKEAVDMLGNISVSEDKQLNRKLSRTDIPISQLVAVFFNQKDNGALKVKEVRQALTLAVDRTKLINDIFPGHARAIGSPVLPGYPGNDSSLMPVDFNLAQANNILEQAGWKMTDKNIRQKGTQQLTLTFTTPDDPTYVATAEELITNWRSIGASVELKKVDPTIIQRDVIRPRKYEALLFGHIYDASGDLFPFWHSSQQKDPGYNLSMFYSRAIDKDLEEARATTSFDKLTAAYQDFQRILATEQPAIFLVQKFNVIVHRSFVRGVSVPQLVGDGDRYSSIHQWYVKTKLSWR